MKLPKKGEKVPLNKIKEICIHFNLIHLWNKIENNPPNIPFKSDGCSCWPDMWKNKDGVEIDLYQECLIHDLFYWSGYSGENIARFFADTVLMLNVVYRTKRPALGLLMFVGVRLGGVSWLPTKFKWSFGRV